MNNDQAHVTKMIQVAFGDVVLGGGVGLLEGQGLDDYATEQVRAELRSRDEKEDWTAIPVSMLNSCASSLSFLDAEGMRFHLPAYVIAHLEGTLQQDVVFHLSYPDTTRFALLTDAQHNAIRAFLVLHLEQLDDPGREFLGPAIVTALQGYWAAR